MASHRHGPDHRELGWPIPLSEVLARTDGAVVLLQGIQVFSDGFCLSVDAVRVRADRDESAWNALISDISGEFIDVLDDRSALNIHIATGAGSQAGDPGVILLNGYQQSTDTSSKTHVSCWAALSFSREAVTIAVDWPSAGVPLTKTTLSGEMLAAASARARNVL